MSLRRHQNLRRIKYLGAILVLVASPWAMPAPAAEQGTWKCTTADGGVAYVNNRLSSYRNCRKLDVPGLPAAPAGTASVTPTTPAPAGTWQYREPAPAEAPAAAVQGSDAEAGETRVVRGAVYRVRRPDGVNEYTNIRPRGGKGEVALLFHYIATCRACDVNSTIDWASTPLQLERYAVEIGSAASEYGLDAALLRALIHAESAFDPRALSHKGAQGLTQLMPATASSLGVQNAFDPAENIRGGARYLAGLLRDFNGDERLATAAYNAGPGAVRKYDGVPPYAETRVYVDRVADLARRYRTALAAPVAAAGAAAGAAAAQ